MTTAPSSAPETADAEPRNGFDRFFEITRRRSTVGTEVRGGIVTFVTMAYIVILNPIILSSGVDVDGGQLGFAAVAAATALTAGVMTILFGLVTRLPFAFAAGLGDHAGARQFGLSYSRLMNGLKKADITLDRKVLADLAVHDIKAFGALAEKAKASLAA